MAAKDTKLMVFAHLGTAWAPCGQLVLTEEADRLLASSFAYGLNYLKRSDALEVDPVNLSLADREAVRAKRLLPANRLPFFGGIRDAAPDAWGRRVIEAKLKVPANSLPESQYLLHAGSERVGALDIRRNLHDSPAAGASAWHTLAHLLEAAERIDEGLPIPAHLEAIFIDGTALGGARPKASIRDEAGVLCLAKFASRHDAFDIPAIECASGAATSPRPACRRPSRTRSPRRFGTSTMSPLQPCGSCFRKAGLPTPAATLPLITPPATPSDP